MGDSRKDTTEVDGVDDVVGRRVVVLLRQGSRYLGPAVG